MINPFSWIRLPWSSSKSDAEKEMRLIKRAEAAETASREARVTNKHAVRSTNPDMDGIELQIQQAKLTLASRQAKRDLMLFQAKRLDREARRQKRRDRFAELRARRRANFNHLRLAYKSASQAAKMQIQKRVEAVTRRGIFGKLRVWQIRRSGYAQLYLSYFFSGVGVLLEGAVRSIGYGLEWALAHVGSVGQRWVHKGTIAVAWVLQEIVSGVFFLSACFVEGIAVILMAIAAILVSPVVGIKALVHHFHGATKDVPLTAPAAA